MKNLQEPFLPFQPHFLPPGEPQSLLHFRKMQVLVAQSCPTPCDPMDSHQAPLSMGFSRQEYWSGLPFPSPGDLPDPGIRSGDQTRVSRIAGRFFTAGATREVLTSIPYACYSLSPGCTCLFSMPNPLFLQDPECLRNSLLRDTTPDHQFPPPTPDEMPSSILPKHPNIPPLEFSHLFVHTPAPPFTRHY